MASRHIILEYPADTAYGNHIHVYSVLPDRELAMPAQKLRSHGRFTAIAKSFAEGHDHGAFILSL